jgi:hypothetical protein
MIWTSKTKLMASHGENILILKLMLSKHKASSMLEPLNIKLTQLLTEQLIMNQDILLHMLTYWHKTEPKNGMRIYYGMLDQLNFIEKELQSNIMITSNTRKMIKLGNKHGRRK